MQAISDVLVALLVWCRDFLPGVWPSLLLIAAAYALRRRRAFPLIAPRRSVAYASIAVLALVAAASRTSLVGDPHPPWYTDDFGYALTADTFVHGRITNPPHPMRDSFMSLYVLQTPTYNSMYQAGPGLLVAAGQVLFHRRVVALWIASAAAACASCWAVEAAVPFAIAWLAGLLMAIHPVMLDWTSHYHGAPLIAFGGALTIGGALRLRKQPARLPQIAMGAGMAILANMRPYEGFVIAVIALLLAWRFVPLAMGIALFGLAVTAYYDRAVTGNALLLPYSAYNARYLSAPNFIWQGPYPKREYPTAEMEKRYRIFRHYYERSRNLKDFFSSARGRIREMLTTAIPTVPHESPANSLRLIAGLPLAFAFLRKRAIVMALLAFAVAMLVITWWPQTHYFAAAVALFASVYASGVSDMIDRRLCVLAYLAISVSFLLAIWASIAVVTGPRPEKVARVAVTEALSGRPGGHLVIVDSDCEDLTFNAADVDASKIVWANATSDPRRLFDYYREREVWRIACGPIFHLSRIRAPLTSTTRTYEPDPY